MTPQNTRKRFKLDDTLMDQPLRSKPVNVVVKSKTVKSPNVQKRRKVDGPYSSVFDHQHVEIRLADQNWRIKTAGASSDNSHERSKLTKGVCGKDKSSGARRLKIKKSLQAIDLPRPFLDADRSIQLDDFDQPPESTSTPIIGSPRPASSDIGPYGRLKNEYENSINDQDLDPWVLDEHWSASYSPRYEEPFAPGVSPAWHPGYIYGIPLAPSSRNRNKSGVLRSQHTPLKNRGFENFPQQLAGGPTVETYPWYTAGTTYKSRRNFSSGERLDVRNTSRNSYKSSGGEATRSS
ncbi:Spo13p LALA0_S09e01134g [Lachancea lanzarotensis]|uniref:LALA0S09e01134g1_1 n=1 Tax=Lachancea lanzarotensis TaxID=1245769 RepID=A0A0C7N0Q6_9SACH|nr:uncharacterized protein LALA0_S09e01134g [Lachancea lanzarotensis]CEP63727.1 LALA0S09e01134g1_1 [Lachancea lanzarotensis]